MVDVALIDPDVAAFSQSQAVAAASQFDAAQAEKSNWLSLADVEDVLLGIWPGEDHAGTLRRCDPDGGLCRAADLDIPQPVHAVSASG